MDGEQPRALVVFHNNGAGVGRRWLHKRYQHVFVALPDGSHWITIDGRAGQPVFEVVANINYDLAGFYRAQGFDVVETARRRCHFRWPWITATCVGATKRILGLRAPWVVTPYQLLKYLKR
ncbi:MAG: hypothetical protein ACTSX7_14085 [Alphaproteobacteria bacterium]